MPVKIEDFFKIKIINKILTRGNSANTTFNIKQHSYTWLFTIVYFIFTKV
ncbi:hypothetical protein LYSIN_00028 [Lysinibacillus sphaericus]|uniref:Uncharacterized protein n=1 Tax=Lysinibacillus sphaericus TaxID=1421 RepID=A0A2S5CWU3_LYSSH|nr:hypothetical protein LYSIN_00028 [Lysinibacillus sphaericus]